jgi:hypothetical protein
MPHVIVWQSIRDTPCRKAAAEMDMRKDGEWQEALPTLGELCQAIAEGRVVYKKRHRYVEVTVWEVRRLAREDRVLRRAVMSPYCSLEHDASHARGLA